MGTQGGAALRVNSRERLISEPNKFTAVELRHIRSFLSLAKTPNFSRTAAPKSSNSTCQRRSRLIVSG